jgi:hypothetical protein
MKVQRQYVCIRTYVNKLELDGICRTRQVLGQSIDCGV